jgi:hypothetical protein
MSAPLAAQSRQMFAIQASGLLVSLNGSSFSDLGFGTGAGGEFQLRVNPSAFSVGAGVQITSHSANSGFQDKLSLIGFFVEPRYAIPVSSTTVFPYVAGRLAVLNQSITLQGGTHVTASGTAVGVGGGMVIPLSHSINLDLGVALTSASFGDYTIGSQTTTESAGSGSSVVIKAGLNIGLGH